MPCAKVNGHWRVGPSADGDLCHHYGIVRCPLRPPRLDRVITSAGLLTRRSLFDRAFPWPIWGRSGICRSHSPLTVAGAVADLHRVPFSPNVVTNTETEARSV